MLKSHADNALLEFTTNPEGPRGHSAKASADIAGVHVAHARAIVLTTMPRGGLQIAQPGKVPEGLLKAYASELDTEDRYSWTAIREGRAINAADAGRHFEDSRFFREVMAPLNYQHLAIAPLKSPVFAGYPGVLHVYRTAEQGPFSAAELNELNSTAHHLDQGYDRARRTRQGANSAQQPWAHQLPVKQVVFDAHAERRLGQEAFALLDSRLREQILAHVRQRLTNGHSAVEPQRDRLMLPDARGDVWIFRVSSFSKFPALGDGPFVFVCLQPECRDWATIRSSDFQADPELTRLVPAMHFMQEEFHRGPTLHEISKTVHLSPFHFHRRFTELLGITPKHFMLECQIDLAKSRLVHGERELVDIAKDCGFAHQSHFTSRFKQATGLTPTRWRRIAGSTPSVRN